MNYVSISAWLFSCSPKASTISTEWAISLHVVCNLNCRENIISASLKFNALFKLPQLQLHERQLWPFTWAPLAAMANDFDVDRKQIQLNICTKWLQPASFHIFCYRVRSKRFFLLCRDSVTLLLPIRYLMQSYIVWINLILIYFLERILTRGGGGFKY